MLSLLFCHIPSYRACVRKLSANMRSSFRFLNPSLRIGIAVSFFIAYYYQPSIDFLYRSKLRLFLSWTGFSCFNIAGGGYGTLLLWVNKNYRDES